MFTGIVEQLGEVVEMDVSQNGARLTIHAGSLATGVNVGDSVAVNGVCLTAVEVEPPRLVFQAVLETLRRSNLDGLVLGTRVNLERPLAADGRLSGHFVQGHVDGLAYIEAISPEGDSLRIRFGAPAPLLRYVVEKGSVAVDGISLTVTAADANGFEVAIIPHTRAVTNLGRRRPGDAVNLEVDMLAKYVEKLACR